MSTDFFYRLGLFLVLGFLQVLVFNHMHLFGYAIPFVYVFFVLTFRRNYPRWAVLLWCFCLGLAIDVFSSTPGVAAAALTFIGLLQPYMLTLFAPRDSAEDMEGSIRTLGITRFLYYDTITSFIFCLLFFALEDFSFFNILSFTASVLGSTAFTAVTVYMAEYICHKQ